MNKLLENFLTSAQVAEALGVSVRTLERWRNLNYGPPVSYVGRKPFYHSDNFVEWLKGNNNNKKRLS